MGILHRSGGVKKLNDHTRLILTAILGVLFGFFIGLSFPSLSLKRINLSSGIISSLDLISDGGRSSRSQSSENSVTDFDEHIKWLEAESPVVVDAVNKCKIDESWMMGELWGLEDEMKEHGKEGWRSNVIEQRSNGYTKNIILTVDKVWKGVYIAIYVPTNPRGAESLPPDIIEAKSDFYLRRLWGEPSEDLKNKPKYLVTFTVGLDQKSNIDKGVKKFSPDFQILLFHYDGRTSEWDDLEWSKTAIHISVRRQTKWWYAKRFLHPDIVATYEYIFIWDEDLGVEHFNGDKYIQLVKKHGLEISQPGLEPNNGLTWQMTKRRGDSEIHKNTEEKPGWCTDPHLPPCAAFVEIMAPVFSREAWRCVWHMIQNDLVHGWGLDFALRRCVEPAHEKIGVVDSQWIVHQVIPSLGNQGESENGKAPWEGVRARCRNEWNMFKKRLADADKAYISQIGKG